MGAKCPRCGAEIRLSDRAIAQCEYCGAALSSAVQPKLSAPQVKMEATPPEPKSTYRGKTRGIAGSLVLTILTFGIYSIVWYFRLAADLRDAKPDAGIGPGKDFLFIILTLGLYGIYVSYKYPKVVADIQKERCLPIHDFAVLSLVLTLFGLWPISHCIIQAELNKIWAQGAGAELA